VSDQRITHEDSRDAACRDRMRQQLIANQTA
jgi:hypothetical protein